MRAPGWRRCRLAFAPPSSLLVCARSQSLSALRRYYLDARQAQPPVEAEKATAEKEEAPEVRVPQPVDAEALLREAEEQAGDQVRLNLVGVSAFASHHRRRVLRLC